MKLRPVLLFAFVLPLVAPLVALRAAPQQQRGANPHGDDRLECAKCHTAEGWTPVLKTPGFKHDQTGFTLEGAHNQVSCRDCHRSLVFARVGTACADCHKDAHKGELGLRCEACHTPHSWANQRSMADRHSRTRFPLVGLHANVDCDSCHRSQQPNQYATTPTECGQCHVQSYLNAKNPNHAAGGFSRRCEDCHTASGWRPATGVDHSTTRFPLTGAHQAVSCARCHVGGKFAGTPLDCYSCHQANYNSTSNPKHVASNFPRTCESCHSTNAWKPASGIDHNKTRFPLTGAHQRVDCTRCHVGGRYAGTATDCYSCHQANYNGTTNPNHASGGFPRTCESCHSTNAWKPASNIDHNKTRFPLTGAHQQVDCARCHVGGRYAGTPTDCYSCHQAKYNSTTNPNHAASNFPRTCESCHTTIAWKPASFDHNKTRFKLTGAHQQVDCARCHIGGRYAGTPTDCYSCHQANYNGTTNPNHVSGGFPRTCESCHSTNAWKPASFDHNKTRFKLTGAHQQVDCTRCHVGGRYAGTATDCYSCHQANYNGTTNPNHRAAGFPTDCQGCHTTNAWRPASFDHDGRFFPIYSGKHRGVWTSCQTCHVNPANYKAFECINCHEHEKSRTDSKHRDVGGYSYSSPACYRCHPRGVGGD
jgi:hypothetical protein